MSFRRGPNMSQYNANLNLINPMYGTVEPLEETYDQGNLDLFANADFFDWEMGHSISGQPGQAEQRGKKDTMESADTSLGAFQGFDIDLNLDIDVLSSANNPFGHLTNDFSPELHQVPHPVQQQPQLQQQQHSQQHRPIVPAATRSHQPIQQRPRNLAILPQPPQSSPLSPQTQSSAFASPSQSPLSANPNSSNHLKRKSVALDSGTPVSLEDASRAVAEEDKRRRNTAASARFRVKKKQREQALEKHSKELENKCQNLDNRVVQLETENKWLRELLMEKHGNNEDFLDMIKNAPFPLNSLTKREPVVEDG